MAATNKPQVHDLGTAYQAQMRAMAWGHIGAVMPVATPTQQEMQDWELAKAERARLPDVARIRAIAGAYAEWSRAERLALARALVPDALITQDWQPMATADKTGGPLLLRLDPPLDTNDVEQWVPADKLHAVVGWWDGERWACGLTEEACRDSQGNPIALRPTDWRSVDADLAPPTPAPAALDPQTAPPPPAQSAGG